MKENKMRISESIYGKILKNYGSYYSELSRLDPRKLTNDALDQDKPHEQLEIIKRFLPDGVLRGKKLLEIGSGFGIFNTIARKEYGIDAWGVEPSGEGFGDTYGLSLEILKENGLDEGVIKNVAGEALPFQNESFDIVYSTNVLEHVTSPRKVIEESIRICKSGGVIQIVVPNHGSFYEGHYAVPYFPYSPKWLFKFFLRLFFRRTPDFADTLRTDINYFSVRKWLIPFVRSGTIEIISFGEEIFRERMTTLSFYGWAGLSKVKKWVEFLHRVGLVLLATKILVFFKAHTPLIITIRKK